jgi:hypothetical protein
MRLGGSTTWSSSRYRWRIRGAECAARGAVNMARPTPGRCIAARCCTSRVPNCCCGRKGMHQASRARGELLQGGARHPAPDRAPPMGRTRPGGGGRRRGARAEQDGLEQRRPLQHRPGDTRVRGDARSDHEDAPGRAARSPAVPSIHVGHPAQPLGLPERLRRDGELGVGCSLVRRCARLSCLSLSPSALVPPSADLLTEMHMP